MAALTAPPSLPTASSRRRRRRLAVLLVISGTALASVFTLLTVRAITKPGAQVSLGDDTFRVGDARTLARRVARDDYPLLFQDLRDKSIDLFVDHDRSRSALRGWRAFEAHAPDAPRHCQLRWDRQLDQFADPCSDKRYPADGSGLRAFPVRVRDGVLVVDFRKTLGK